jgi:hypothetical protein
LTSAHHAAVAAFAACRFGDALAEGAERDHQVVLDVVDQILTIPLRVVGVAEVGPEPVGMAKRT